MRTLKFRFNSRDSIERVKKTEKSFFLLELSSFELPIDVSVLWRGKFGITLEATIKLIGDFRFEFVFSVWLLLLLLPNKNITNNVFVLQKHKINKRYLQIILMQKNWCRYDNHSYDFFPDFREKKLELCQLTIRVLCWERERERIELQQQRRRRQHNFKDIFYVLTRRNVLCVVLLLRLNETQ